MTQPSKILIVEDRTDWQDIVSSTISAEGYIPSAVDSYDSAVTALDTDQFDLAVIDPVLDTDRRINRDGLTVIQKISEMQPNTPMVIITGSLTPDIQMSLRQLCPTAPIFLKERWNPVEFVDSVHKLVGQKWEQPTVSTISAEDSAKPGKKLTPPSTQERNYPRVLVVENDESWQSIITEILEEDHCFWRASYTAKKALHELETQSFHVIILDLKLQHNSLPLRSNEGWLLLDHVVAHYPKSKVIVISGKASAGDVAHLLTQYSAVRFIEKQNFTPEALREAMSEATKRPELHIRTFGQFRVIRNGEVVGVWEPPETELIIKLLLSYRARNKHTMAVDELIARVWPGADIEEGRKRLLPSINAARHILEPDIEPRDSSFILRGENGYYFDLNNQVEWDVQTFQRILENGKKLVAEKQWQEAMVELERGQASYRGDFLAEDRHLDWANDTRRTITRDYCELMTYLADTYAAKGQYTEAIQVCETILRKDPLLEDIYRRLMQFHYCLGNKQQALKAYRDCIKLFEELFGESPTPETMQIQQAILNDEDIDCMALR